MHGRPRRLLLWALPLQQHKPNIPVVQSDWWGPCLACYLGVLNWDRHFVTPEQGMWVIVEAFQQQQGEEWELIGGYVHSVWSQLLLRGMGPGEGIPRLLPCCRVGRACTHSNNHVHSHTFHWSGTASLPNIALFCWLWCSLHNTNLSQTPLTKNSRRVVHGQTNLAWQYTRTGSCAHWRPRVVLLMCCLEALFHVIMELFSVREPYLARELSNWTLYFKRCIFVSDMNILTSYCAMPAMWTCTVEVLNMHILNIITVAGVGLSALGLGSVTYSQ